MKQIVTLRDAVSQSFSPQVWNAVKDHLSPPDQLKAACLEEFKKNSTGERIEILRAALTRLDNTGLIKMDE
jgi:hypothetical protein